MLPHQFQWGSGFLTVFLLVVFLWLESLRTEGRASGPPFKAKGTMASCQNVLALYFPSGEISSSGDMFFYDSLLLPLLPYMPPPLVQTLPFLGVQIGLDKFPWMPHGASPAWPWGGKNPLPFCHLIHPIKQWGKAGCFLDSKYPNWLKQLVCLF